MVKKAKTKSISDAKERNEVGVLKVHQIKDEALFNVVEELNVATSLIAAGRSYLEHDMSGETEWRLGHVLELAEKKLNGVTSWLLQFENEELSEQQKEEKAV